MSSSQRFGGLVAALLIFGVLATANSGGYRFGVSDQSYYAVAVLARANPALYPKDAPLLNAQSRFMLSDDLLGWILRTTGVELSTLCFALYLLTMTALFAAAVTLARRLGLSWWAIAALLLLLTLRHRITKTGANTLEGYTHVRMLAFALGVVALACLVRARLGWSIVWVAASAVLHTTTALWFGVAIAIGAVTTRPAWRWTAMLAAIPAIVVAAWAVMWGPLAGHLVVMDAPWLEVLKTRDYLFPSAWPWEAWVVNLIYPWVILLIFRARRAQGVATDGERAIVAGMIGLLAVFLLSVPFSAARVALAVQLQVNRVFWLMDFVATVYVAWWLLDRVAARGHARARIAVLVLLAALSIGRGVYVLAVEADRRLVQVSISDGPWRDAMTWLKQQPAPLHVLADPFHPWKYGVSVRLAGEKDVLLDQTKDPALATYDRAIAMRVGERAAALEHFDAFTTADVRALASRYNLDVLVVDSTRVFDFPALYRNGGIIVYRLEMIYSVPSVPPAPFAPRRWLSNGDAMTVFAWGRARLFSDLPEPEARRFRISPDTEVMARCFWQSSRAAVPTLLVLHGLEGSSEAHYMRGMAHKAWRRGWNAVLLNQRNCGGTEHLARGLYHSGLTSDPRDVMRALVATEGLKAFGVVGYSLGGNLTIKLAGELGDGSDPPIRAVVGISPTIDLNCCVSAIERRRNVVYHWNFVRHLKERMRRKVEVLPGCFDLSPLARIRSIRAFDEAYTAPHHGFQGATDYYYRASAMRVVDRIRIPALILTADDDPFVPSSQFGEPAVRNNPNIVVRVEQHGGHCGFVGEAVNGSDGYWAEETAVQFIAAAINSR